MIPRGREVGGRPFPEKPLLFQDSQVQTQPRSPGAPPQPLPTCPARGIRKMERGVRSLARVALDEGGRSLLELQRQLLLDPALRDFAQVDANDAGALDEALEVGDQVRRLFRRQADRDVPQ